MLDHAACSHAIHTQAATLAVVTTGSVSLGATATGFTRATGSFVTDGFLVGMEVTPSGFALNTTPVVIVGVTDTALNTLDATSAESAASGRTLTVGYPTVASENITFTPTPNRWYVNEQYLPGPGQQVEFGPGAALEIRPTMVFQVFGIANTGPEALYKVADGLLALFPPHQALPLATGDVARVRTDVMPFRGQLQAATPGWSVVPVTVPLRVRTPNSI